MTEKLLSVVIANYNYGRFLAEAIESVLSQSCGDYELIIVDGGSTDDSVQIIKRYSHRIAWWVSEPDDGQAAAFNKGFRHASGRFLTWLNADDVLLPNVVMKLKKAVAANPNIEWFVGGCFWLDPSMKIINCARARPFSEIRYREGIVSTWGPSSFFSKRLLDAVDGVDERFQLAMDTDLWLRFAYMENARYVPFINYARGLRLHPDAKTSGHNFLPDGTFDRCSSENERIKRSKHLGQMKIEGDMIRNYFKSKKGNALTWLLSISWVQVIAGRIDRMMFRGKYYKEYYK